MHRKSLNYANNKFGLNIFKVVQKDAKERNTFVSPISIQAAIAMTYIGARDKTAREIATVLAWDEFDDESIHKQFQEYFIRLEKGYKASQLSMANRIYIERTFEVVDQFRQDVKKFYLTDPVSANFKLAPDDETVKINSWVAERTQNKIQDLLVPGILRSDSSMVLINAIYFQGKWDCPFLARDTVLQPFKITPDKTIQVPTMTGTHVFGFTKDSSLQCSALEMTYKGNDFSFVIILPDEDFGLEALVQKLDEKNLDRLLTNVATERDTIMLSLPKFEITSAFALKHPLSDMGMADAFIASANFSGISCDSKGLHLSDVIHKSYLRVDEKGTEAAAATAAIMIPECDIQSTPLRINHPFLFALVDRRYKNLLMFCGQIIDPSINP